MNDSLLPTYTTEIPVDYSLIDNFFKKVYKRITVPDCGSNPTPKAYRSVIRAVSDEILELEKVVYNSRTFEKASILSSKRLEYLKRTLVHYQMALNGYSEIIDLKFLGEYLEDPHFGVTTTTHQSGGMLIECDKPTAADKPCCAIKPKLPPDITAYYQPVMDRLSRDFLERSSGKSYYYSEPSGMMDDKLRAWLDLSERSGYFTDVFVIFVAKWEKNKKVTVQKDPLLVGRHISKFGPFDFLIGMYNPAPIEEYMAMKHSMPPMPYK